MAETIDLLTVLDEIDTGNTFDMTFITCDRRRGTGGEIVEVKGWAKVKREKGRGDEKSASFAASKNPNHFENKTINIVNPRNRRLHPVKVHWYLIEFFNGKRVIK